MPRFGDVAHVLRQLGGSLDRIRSEGEAEVKLAGRPFRIRRSFVEDVETQRLDEKIRTLGRALLVLHAPRDEVVGIENASRIFLAARHPKSFISLDDADHLLSRPKDASYAAGVIAAWAARYIPESRAEIAQAAHVVVRETGEGKFQNLQRIPIDLIHSIVMRGLVLPQWQPRSGIVHAVIPSRRGLLPSVRALLDFLAQECAARCQLISGAAS